MLHTGLGGYSLSAEIMSVATLGEIFMGWPSGPATVRYFFVLILGLDSFETISLFSCGLLMIDFKIFWFSVIESFIFSASSWFSFAAGLLAVVIGLEFFLKKTDPKKIITIEAAAVTP